MHNRQKLTYHNALKISKNATGIQLQDESRILRHTSPHILVWVKRPLLLVKCKTYKSAYKDKLFVYKCALLEQFTPQNRSSLLTRCFAML
jgi:hypothetical protein